MSFRIKPTHEFLKPVPPPPSNNNTLESILQETKKDNPYYPGVPQKSDVTKVVAGSNQGLGIRSNFASQPDYM